MFLSLGVGGVLLTLTVQPSGRPRCEVVTNLSSGAQEDLRSDGQDISMTQIDKGRSASSHHSSLSGHVLPMKKQPRIRVPGVKASKSALRRGGGALAGTALAAGLIVGGSGVAQAQPPRALQTPPAVQPGAMTGQGIAVQRRLDGIRQDLARAVAVGDVTQEQADAFVAKIVRHMD